MNEFYKGLSSQGVAAEELIISKTPHPTIEGIYEIEYRLPIKDKAGNVTIPPSYRNISIPKTVYDINVFTDEEIYNFGIEAMKEGKLQDNGYEIIGYAPNGLKFKGFYRNGEITNIYPLLP